MYGYTKSTPLDRTYRYSEQIDITPQDEGAAVYLWVKDRPIYVGVIIKQDLVTRHYPDCGYLQHGEGTQGPFRTERVSVKSAAWPDASDWLAFYEERWRKVHMQVKRLYIVYRGEKITIQIEGV